MSQGEGLAPRSPICPSGRGVCMGTYITATVPVVGFEPLSLLSLDLCAEMHGTPVLGPLYHPSLLSRDFWGPANPSAPVFFFFPAPLGPRGIRLSGSCSAVRWRTVACAAVERKPSACPPRCSSPFPTLRVLVTHRGGQGLQVSPHCLSLGAGQLSGGVCYLYG